MAKYGNVDIMQTSQQKKTFQSRMFAEKASDCLICRLNTNGNKENAKALAC